MVFVPRIAKLTLISLTLAGLSVPVFARGISPGNGGSIILTPLPLPSLPAQDVQTFSDSYSGGNALEQRFGVYDGTFDFFSVRPDGDFKPLLRGGVGDGGLQLQLKW